MQHRLKNLAGISLVVLLAACGTPPKLPVASSKTAAGTVAAKPLLPPANSGRGGYYKDDGPAENVPENLLATPDPIPTVEPYSRPAARPYSVLGKTYTPITDDKPFKQRGFGTWYGKKFHGQKTASGERYDMFKMTAAHPTLPIPSFARVTNLDNGAQVIVRINDRGPFHASRIIDLSYTAALKLGYINQGTGNLEVERLLPEDIERLAKNPPEPALPGAPPVRPDLIGELIQSAGAGGAQEGGTGIYLQFGSYAQIANAEGVLDRLLPKWAEGKPPLEIVEYGGVFRVYSGPYASRSEAQQAAQQVRATGVQLPVVVTR